MQFNLGNFGGQLKLDELNGALGKAGGGFQFGQAPAAPAAPVQQTTDTEVPGQTPPDPSRFAEIANQAQAAEEAKRKSNNKLSTVLGIVGSIYGGPMGGSIGSALGGMANGGRG